MTNFSDFAEAARAVVDPTTSPSDLAAIAEEQPGLWAQIAGHPAAYPELLAWLDSVGDTSVKAAIAARRPEPSYYAQQTQQWTPEWAATPVQPTMVYPQPRQTQAAQAAPAPAAKQSFLESTKGRIILIASGAAVVLIVIIALIVNYAVLVPERDVEASFNTAVAAYQQAQADLNTQLTAANITASAFTADTVTDGTTLDSLNAKIQEATASAAQPVPVMASGTSEIQQQVNTLTTATAAMRLQIDDLNVDIGNVQSSGLLWAKSTLTSAIADANNTYSQYSYTTDTGALDALQTQITSAQQVLTSIDQVDPNTVVSVANDALSALSDAQAAVVATAPPHCGDVTLPAGVDPMVCSGLPNNTVTLPGVPGFGGMFQTPSKNIGCYPTGSGVICEVASHSWKMPSTLMAACNDNNTDQLVPCDASILMIDGGDVSSYAHGDVPQWADAKSQGLTIPSLAYGKVIDYTPAACLSASDGLTCWDTTTYHGFKVSQSKLLYW